MGPQGPSPLPALCPGASLLPHPTPPPASTGSQGCCEVEGRAWWEGLVTSLQRGMVQVTQSISPAHDLVGEQHSAHFRVLVLPLIDDGLGEGEVRRVEGKEVPLKSRWWHRGGPVGLHWHLPSPGRGEALLPEKIMPSTLLWGSPGVQSRSLESCCPGGGEPLTLKPGPPSGWQEWHEICRVFICLEPGRVPRPLGSRLMGQTCSNPHSVSCASPCPSILPVSMLPVGLCLTH
jgi:hypothetical protein